MEDMHPPNVVTLSLANAELGSSESTSPLASAPSSPRGSPDARASSIISTPTRAASQQQQQQKQLDEDLVPDDEEILYSPAQQQYPQQYQQHQQPPFVATGNVNMSFQDDEEQDEASHLHDQQGLHGRKDHFFPVSNSSLLVIRNEMDDDFDDHDDGRETPFDEATGPDHHFTIRKDWMSSSSSADPSLDGHESERIQSIIHNIHDAENGHHNEKQATTTTSLADDEDSQPPSLAPLDRMDPVPVPPPASTRTMQDMDSSASHLCLLSTPTPVSTMRNLYEPAQDPEEEMNEPITQTALNSTMIMTTPDHPLKSPPILVKTTNLVPVWDLPINGQQESAVLRSKSEASESASSSSSSLFTPPVPPPPPGEESTRDDEPHLTDERRLTKLPTLRESMMSGGVPMINDSAPVSRAVDDPMSTKLEGDDDEGEGDDDDDDVVNAMGMVSQRHNPIPRGGPSLAKPAALRSTSAPVHALYATDPTRTNPSPFSFHDDGQRGEGTIPEPSYMIREKSPLSLLEERPERVLRSVSDIPKSSSMSDWKKYLVDDSPQVKGIADISQWLDKDDTKQFEPRRKTSFREMTPKQDFKLSEKSAAWLQEEFKRRSTIKKEINAAILARSDLRKEDHEIHNEGSFRMEDAMALQASFSTSASEVGGEDAFAMALSKALKALPQSSISAATAAELSQRSEDDEVAALTAFRSSQQPIESSLQTIPSDEEGVTRPRRLMYGTSIPRSSSEPVVFSGESHDETIDFREDMMQFSTETRRMLHQSHMFSRKSGDPDLRFNWLNASNSNRNFESPMEVPGVLNGTLHRPTISAMTDASDSSPYDDLVTPPLVESLDSYLGIAKGDITLSLLNEDHSISARSTWANRVRVAIWRTRRMRRGRAGGTSVLQEHRQSNPSSRGRSSHHVDTDTARVAGGVRSVEASEQSALDHLMNDRIDEALECFEEIIFAYYNYFERSLKAREANPGGSHPTTDFRPYIGAALHNLGVLNLLKGEYSQALSYFGRAVENRKGCLGESHNDHVASLVKVATCHYAVNEFSEAHAKFEEALEYSRQDAKRIEDRMQMAETLNNLGCLAYMCGQPTAASSFFRESMDVQFNLMGQSLYLCSADVGQSISLNLSITRANIGFIKLVTNELPSAVTALENALMEQQLLLTGASASLLATMDHLAVANLLNGESDKAAMMFGRIFELQRREYGAQDSRCFITMDKINMVKSSGTKFEEAVAELRKTFSLPETETRQVPAQVRQDRDTHPLPKSAGGSTPTKSRNSKNKVMKVLTSIRKKK